MKSFSTATSTADHEKSQNMKHEKENFPHPMAPTFAKEKLVPNGTNLRKGKTHQRIRATTTISRWFKISLA